MRGGKRAPTRRWSSLPSDPGSGVRLTDPAELPAGRRRGSGVVTREGFGRRRSSEGAKGTACSIRGRRKGLRYGLNHTSCRSSGKKRGPAQLRRTDRLLVCSDALDPFLPRAASGRPGNEGVTCIKNVDTFQSPSWRWPAAGPGRSRKQPYVVGWASLSIFWMAFGITSVFR